ncbi:MAG: hypothetical protein DRQ64_00345 [Gammaproteobacteria bacterium]|nr:MAG: hypothetical protein DRQ64_00345 [Gammaproteobacteria bacterium]
MSANRDLLRWAQAWINKIEADERHHYEPALVQVNAPLALIQVGMKGNMEVLIALRDKLRLGITKEWHEHAYGPMGLREALEMTMEDYKAWVENHEELWKDG